jgi:hypothetical protein
MTLPGIARHWHRAFQAPRGTEDDALERFVQTAANDANLEVQLREKGRVLLSCVSCASARKSAPLSKQQLRQLPRLLREDVEVRGQVIASLSEYLTTREETAAILAELRQMRADFDARLDAFERRREEQGRRIEEQGRRIDDHTQALAALQRQVMGLGARWGLMSEEAFRSGVRRPQRRLIISPYVEPRAREVAARLDIEVCEGVTPPEL